MPSDAALVEAVREDPDLTPAEKETTIGFPKDSDRATVFTAENALMRRLIAHPAATVGVLNTIRDGTHTPGVRREDYQGGAVVGVRATVPVACLMVKSEPRQSTGHAHVISQRALATLNDDNGGSP